MSSIDVQRQPPASSGYGKTTLEKRGREPPNVTLGDIVDDLSSYFNEFPSLRQAKKQAEEKYDIIKEHDDCWKEDDIKRAWGKTQRMGKQSVRRQHWALVILFQVIEKQRRKEEDFDLMEGRSLLQRCAELSLSDMIDQMKAGRENGRWDDCDMSQACGKAENMKGNSEDMSSQSTAELETLGAAGGVKQSSGGTHTSSSYSWQTSSASQGQSGTLNGSQGRSGTLNGSQDTGNSAQLRSGVALQNGEQENEPIYIRIPLGVMCLNEQPVIRGAPGIRSNYKLINGFPSQTDLRKRKSYAMSFNNGTMNAEWVYEILNRSTIADSGVLGTFGHVYHKGHLAAAANHSWCREAYNDTFLSSNLVPQHRTLNTGPWSVLERYCRTNLLNQNNIRNVHVYTGPLYIRVMNIGRLAGKVVPSHLFKVIIVENMDGTVEEPECYVFPNGNPPEDPLRADERQYRRTIEDIEGVSGLTFTERRPHVRHEDGIVTVRLQGEDGMGVPRDAVIGVRISL
ncbi:hypothetical protein ABG768_020577 [Culter alburnus]|uniref:DNA/RNA non-specific endonuclease domain-containing protein n=1 Tax=Culter alburnus TaxID=194366 RepID=A0AAW2B1M6_CULAL